MSSIWKYVNAYVAYINSLVRSQNCTMKPNLTVPNVYNITNAQVLSWTLFQIVVCISVRAHTHKMHAYIHTVSVLGVLLII